MGDPQETVYTLLLKTHAHLMYLYTHLSIYASHLQVLYVNKNEKKNL